MQTINQIIRKSTLAVAKYVIVDMYDNQRVVKPKIYALTWQEVKEKNGILEQMGAPERYRLYNPQIHGEITN